MNKALILLCIVFGMVHFSRAQNSYVKRISVSDLRGQVLLATDSEENTYLSFIIELTDSESRINLLKTDRCGEYVWHRTFLFSNISSFNLVDLIISSKDGIYVGSLGRNMDEYVGYVIKVDTAGELLFSKRINSNTSFYLYNLSEYVDGSIMVFGNRVDPDNACIVFLNEDNGDIMEQRKGISTVIWGFTIPTQDSGFICRNGSIFYKLNSDFEQEWGTIIGGIGATRKPIEVEDGYIYSKFRYGSTAENFLIKVDFDGNLVWQTDKKPSSGSTSIELRSDGLIGQIGITASNTPYALPYLVLINTEGETILERLFDPFGEATGATDLVFLNDKSALISGSIQGDVFLIKTDPALETICDFQDIATTEPPSALNILDYNANTGAVEVLSNADVNTRSNKGENSIVDLCEQVVSLPELPNSDTLCFGDTMYVDITDPGIPFEWENGEATLSRTIFRPGTYKITYFLCDEEISDQFVITQNECIPDVYIPNAFTPNADGTNDEFLIYTLDDLIDFRMSVYNRWGDQVYLSFQSDTGWDGRFRSAKMPTGVYIYNVYFQSPSQGQNKDHYFSGDVLLIR